MKVAVVILLSAASMALQNNLQTPAGSAVELSLTKTSILPNGIEYPCHIRGDVTCNGVVDLDDIMVVIHAFQTSPNECEPDVLTGQAVCWHRVDGEWVICPLHSDPAKGYIIEPGETIRLTGSEHD